MKYKNRYIFSGLFVLVSLIVVFAINLLFKYEQKEVIDLHKNELKAIATLKTSQLAGWYADELYDSETIVNNIYLIQRIENWLERTDETNTEILEGRIEGLKNEHGYYSIGFFSPDFKKAVSTKDFFKTDHPIADDIINHLAKQKTATTSGFYKCPTCDKIIIDFFAPVFDDENKNLGYMVFRHDPEMNILPLVLTWPVPSRSSETLIVRKEDDQVVFLSNLRHVKDAALSMKIPLSQTSLPAVFAALGGVGFVEGIDYRGVDVLAYTDHIPGTPWYLVAKTDMDEIVEGTFYNTGNQVIITIFLLLALLGIIALLYLISKKNFYKKLYEAHEEFRITLYSIGDGVITTNNEGQVIHMNPVAEELTGWPEKKAAGKDVGLVFNIVNEQTNKVVENPVEKVMKQGRIVGLANHTVLISRDGRKIPIADSGAPIFDEDGKITGIVLVFRDQTEERENQKKLMESQRKLSTLFSNLPGMAYRCKNDSNWTMEFISNGCAGLTGYASEDLEQNRIVAYNDLIVPADREYVWDEIQKSLAVKKGYTLEYRITTKTGKIKWVWEKGQGIFDDKGKLLALEGFISDINERKLYEEALKASENLFQTLTNKSTVGIFRTDSKGRTTYVNPMWSRLSGLSSFEAQDMKWAIAIHPEDREAVIAGWEEAFNNQKESFTEYRFIHPDGRIVWVSGHAVPEFNAKGDLVGYIGTIFDITQRKEAADQIIQSKLLLRTIIDNLPDAIYMKDAEGKKLIANKADVENCGVDSEEELLGKDDFELFPPEMAQHFWEDDLTVLKKGIPVINREERLTNRSGQTKMLLSSKVPLKDADGNIIGLVGVGRDITREKEAEAESVKLAKAVSQSPVSILITDPKGNIEYVNPKFSEVTGYSFENVIGKNPRILKSGHHDKLFYREMWKKLEAGKDWSGEILNRKKNGELFWESTTISPILDDKGKTLYYVGIKEDITEKKKMMEELVRAKEHAEESDQLKSSFLANMSHEIRTPLNSILGFSNFLVSEESLSEDEKSQYSGIINKSADSLLQIINDIIDISRLETGQLQLFPGIYELSPVIKSLHTVFLRKKLEMGKGNIEIEVETKPGVKVYADENRLIQIFTNLLNNSLKFTEKGSINFGIEDFDDKFVTMFVADTGIGIKKEHQQAVFERFRQGENNKARAKGGNGLGLSIVKNLVELMGGKIWLESEEGKGSVFRFTLPAR